MVKNDQNRTYETYPTDFIRTLSYGKLRLEMDINRPNNGRKRLKKIENGRNGFKKGVKINMTYVIVCR